MTQEPYILHIEDERPLLQLIRHTLKLLGYNVMSVSSGEEGLAMIYQQKPALVLLDLMMPGLDGRGVYRRMKADKNLADIPVIVITALMSDNREGIIVDGLPPVDDYITKPFEVERLIKAVRRFM